MTSLQVEIRQDTGKGAARKLRATGKVPGVIYGPDADPVGVACDPVALTDIFQKTQDRNTLVDLDVDGQTVKVLVREVQRHPLSRELLHIDFYRVNDAREVAVELPVRPVGRPKGATLGGRIRLTRRTLHALCLPADIPEAIEVDVTPMQIGDQVTTSQLKVPNGVRLALKNDIQILVCYGKSKARLALEEEEAAEEEGEESEGEESEGDDASEGEA